MSAEILPFPRCRPALDAEARRQQLAALLGFGADWPLAELERYACTLAEVEREQHAAIAAEDSDEPEDPEAQAELAVLAERFWELAPRPDDDGPEAA